MLLGLTFGLAAVSAALAGVAPAVASTRLDPMAALRRRQQARGRLGPGRYLLAAEAAIAIVLVAGAAGAVRSFAGLILKDPGFDASNLYRASVFFDPSRNLQSMERVRALDMVGGTVSPGVSLRGRCARPVDADFRRRRAHCYCGGGGVAPGAAGGADGSGDSTASDLRNAKQGNITMAGWFKRLSERRRRTCRCSS